MPLEKWQTTTYEGMTIHRLKIGDVNLKIEDNNGRISAGITWPHGDAWACQVHWVRATSWPTADDAKIGLVRYLRDACKAVLDLIPKAVQASLPPPEPEENRDVHTEHCCAEHGCKYSDDDCSVVTGKKRQTDTCEDCDLARM